MQRRAEKTSPTTTAASAPKAGGAGAKPPIPPVSGEEPIDLKGVPLGRASTDQRITTITSVSLTVIDSGRNSRVSTLLPLTPGGAGAQQALLVATLVGPGPIAVLTYSVGQQIAIAAWTVLLAAVALIFVFRTTDWRRLIRSASREAEQHA